MNFPKMAIARVLNSKSLNKVVNFSRSKFFNPVSFHQKRSAPQYLYGSQLFRQQCLLSKFFWLYPWVYLKSGQHLNQVFYIVKKSWSNFIAVFTRHLVYGQMLSTASPWSPNMSMTWSTLSPRSHLCWTEYINTIPLSGWFIQRCFFYQLPIIFVRDDHIHFKPFFEACFASVPMTSSAS